MVLFLILYHFFLPKALSYNSFSPPFWAITGINFDKWYTVIHLQAGSLMMNGMHFKSRERRSTTKYIYIIDDLEKKYPPILSIALEKIIRKRQWGKIVTRNKSQRIRIIF